LILRLSGIWLLNIYGIHFCFFNLQGIGLILLTQDRVGQHSRPGEEGLGGKKF